jgi:hypothetical protein
VVAPARIHIAEERGFTLFELLAVYSKSTAGGSRHRFKIAKDVSTGVITKTCTPTGSGGCPGAGTW